MQLFLVYFIRILLLLDRAVNIFLVIKVLPLLADEELADVRSLVEGLVVDGLVGLHDGRQVHLLEVKFQPSNYDSENIDS
jgi:hypothetical protein